MLDGHMFVFHPISPSQVNEIYQKMSELRGKKKSEEEHVEVDD